MTAPSMKILQRVKYSMQVYIIRWSVTHGLQLRLICYASRNEKDMLIFATYSEYPELMIR